MFSVIASRRRGNLITSFSSPPRFFAEFILSGDSSVASLLQNDINEGPRMTGVGQDRHVANAPRDDNKMLSKFQTLSTARAFRKRRSRSLVTMPSTLSSFSTGICSIS